MGRESCCRGPCHPARRGFLLATLLFLARPLAGSDDLLVRELKVAYLYNFTRFIDWPETPRGDAFVIAVIGDAPLAQALRTLEQADRQARGQPIRIRALDAANERVGAIDDCQMLFVGAAAVNDLPRLRALTAGKPILLVGDSAGLAGRGVAINFFLKPDILGKGQRLRFEIDPKALKARGFRVAAQLYEVAEIVP